MLIKGAQVLDDQWQFSQLDIRIAGDRIAEIYPSAAGQMTSHSPDPETIDAGGLLLIPGLVDIHIHGCNGYDFCDDDPRAIREMARYLLTRGVTSFVGTTMSLAEAQLQRIVHRAAGLCRERLPDGAQLRGIHLEGPFLAQQKKGAQAAASIIDPDLAMLARLQSLADGQVRILAIAPERPGAMAMIGEAARTMTVALAHTISDYETARQAFAAGASHVTHLFNAMPPFTHREPGVIGAASDAGATVELICDGIHLHPSVIRAVFQWFGPDRVVLISDAMRACGLADGQYELGGQAVSVRQGKATLADGIIAGSVTDLMAGLVNAVQFGIPLPGAIKAATFNPARVAGIESQVGSITVGKQADLLLLSPRLEIVRVIHGS